MLKKAHHLMFQINTIGLLLKVFQILKRTMIILVKRNYIIEYLFGLNQKTLMVQVFQKLVMKLYC